MAGSAGTTRARPVAQQRSGSSNALQVRVEVTSSSKELSFHDCWFLIQPRLISKSHR